MSDSHDYHSLLHQSLSLWFNSHYGQSLGKDIPAKRIAVSGLPRGRQVRSAEDAEEDAREDTTTAKATDTRRV